MAFMCGHQDCKGTVKRLKSMGPDRMHPRGPRELAGPLSTTYQRSWEDRELPADWKSARVIPVYKKGTREGPGSYRAVSVTSVPGKVMVKIVPGEH